MSVDELEEMYDRREKLCDTIADLEEKDIPDTENEIVRLTARLKYLKGKHDRMMTDYIILNAEILKEETSKRKQKENPNND